MIVLGERQNDTNILHVIIGPESEFQFNLSGQSIIDITEYINNYKADDKCMLVINKCNSEEELIIQLQMHQAKMKAMGMMSQFAEQMNQHQEDKSTSHSQNKKEEKKKGSGVKCPKCNCPDSAVILDGNVYPCTTCQKIDKGISNGNIPPLPPIEKLDELRKKIETDLPQQKKSIFRFYEAGTDEDSSTPSKNKKKK